jgi:ATP-binding cassette, subfamily B, bacterial
MPVTRAVAVHLRGLTYHYPCRDRSALSAIDYSFEHGTTAIVGPNGAGKSTLVKLLSGLLTPQQGSIEVELSNGARVAPGDLHKAVLFQEPSHLHLTVRQNITMRFARAADEDSRIRRALDFAGLSDVVSALPNGIDTPVGAGFGGSVDLSGGQWQRLALARLIYQDPPLMILDEPVASLDPDGDVPSSTSSLRWRPNGSSSLLPTATTPYRPAQPSSFSLMDELPRSVRTKSCGGDNVTTGRCTWRAGQALVQVTES